jgi:gas vesicle protein
MDQDMYSNDTTSFAAPAFAMLVGAAIGAAIALMFAPATGRDTRDYLGRRGKTLANDVAEQGRKVWNEHGERVTAAVRRGYEQATNAATNAMSGNETRAPRQV